jgi:predicted house-cleaning noncanonical NTP pyrophosphatase (MazG superfamily)
MFHRKALEEIRDILTDASIDHLAVRTCTALVRIDEMIKNEDQLEIEAAHFIRQIIEGHEYKPAFHRPYLETLVFQLEDKNEYTSEYYQDDEPEEVKVQYAVNKNGNPL